MDFPPCGSLGRFKAGSTKQDLKWGFFITKILSERERILWPGCCTEHPLEVFMRENPARADIWNEGEFRGKKSPNPCPVLGILSVLCWLLGRGSFFWVWGAVCRPVQLLWMLLLSQICRCFPGSQKFGFFPPQWFLVGSELVCKEIFPLEVSVCCAHW